MQGPICIVLAAKALEAFAAAANDDDAAFKAAISAEDEVLEPAMAAATAAVAVVRKVDVVPDVAAMPLFVG